MFLNAGGNCDPRVGHVRALLPLDRVATDGGEIPEEAAEARHADRIVANWRSGGVAALNHRLMAANPPGSMVP